MRRSDTTLRELRSAEQRLLRGVAQGGFGASPMEARVEEGPHGGYTELYDGSREWGSAGFSVEEGGR